MDINAIYRSAMQLFDDPHEGVGSAESPVKAAEASAGRGLPVGGTVIVLAGTLSITVILVEIRRRKVAISVKSLDVP